MKFLWCVTPEDEQEIRNRFQMWEKSTGKKKIKLYEDLLGMPGGKLNEEDTRKIKALKKKLEDDINDNLAKEMPHITGKKGLFEDTSHVFGSNVSALLYSQYCSAVHIDTSVLSGLIQSHEERGLAISDDIKEDIGELKKRCLNFAYMFLLCLYKKNKWDIKTIKQEYNCLINELSTV